MLSDDALKHAYQGGSRTSPTLWREELVTVAAKTGAKWIALSKEVPKDLALSS